MSSADSTPPWLTLVGIGEDGYPGLGKQARRALLQASRIVGAARQLELLPPCIGAARETWPTPFSLEPLLARRGQPTCVLASGDPMLFGVGASLARQLPATELRVLPAPSSLSLAAARLGWALQEVACLSLVRARWRRCRHRSTTAGACWSSATTATARPPSPAC
ncbi:Cobalt-precorrin-6y C5-methyltransferase [Pseudomonas paraeruginosa]|nr:Cobalt-precorrin-6y C5-methyltransferase [Pseudomonas aeruginosa]